MQNNMLKVQEDRSWPKKSYDIFTAEHIFFKIRNVCVTYQ